jgi:RNA polymerase sigma-70 factor (ECF subfamily)
MSDSTTPNRLSRIPTLWTLVREAHGEEDERAREAQRAILERYEGAIKRYLLAALRDHDAADEVFQEFAMQFVRGKLRGADPTRGQFRRYLKSVLFHLVADHRKRLARGPRPLDPDAPEPGVCDPEPAEDEAFSQHWREGLLTRTWAHLADHERDTGQPFHSALKLRAIAPPEARSQDLAERLSAQLNRSFTAANVRQIIHRARRRFAELLVEEVRESLHDPTEESLLEELAELRLLEYCKPALEPDKDAAT